MTTKKPITTENDSEVAPTSEQGSTPTKEKAGTDEPVNKKNVSTDDPNGTKITNGSSIQDEPKKPVDPNHRHKFAPKIIKPTCTEQGYTLFTCSCGEEYKEDYKKLVPHTFGNWTITQEPTCLQTGEERQQCKNCTEYKSRVVPAKGHDFGEWYIEKSATCLQTGEERQQCKNCTEYKSRVVPAKGHVFGEWYIEKRATCLKEGRERRNCTGCSEYEVRPIKAKGHNFGQDEIILKPTCTQEGKVEKTCSGCGKTITETIPAMGHSYGGWKETKAPTCTEEGQREKKCSACGETIKETIPAKGHSYGGWKETKAPTCTEEGQREKKCSVCGETVKEKVPAKGHNYQWEITVQATCTIEGKKEYKCATCGKGTNPKTISTGHSEIKAVTMATPTEKDKKENKCTACEELSNVEIIPAKGHSYQWITTIPATCTEEGKKEYKCTVCGKVTETETTPATGHKFTEWKRKKPFSKYRFCENCFTMEESSFGRVTTKVVEPYTRPGKTVTFGQYPQSEVTDSTLKRRLSNLAGTLPTSNNGNGWTSYKYYIEESNSTDFMWYKDVTHNGERYRGVYFTKYRPYACILTSTENNTKQKENGYTPSTLYWFKYEPIQWRILEEKNGYATLLAEKIIDSQDYYSDTETRNRKPVYANNYAQSDIRAWLNDLFYRTAFTSEQQSLIQAVTVDNSADSTTDTKGSVSKATEYACENTTDKVWLLSVREVANTGYGFNADYYYGKDSARQKEGTAYAKCNGLWINSDNGKSVWWLRSPYYDYSFDAWYVHSGGSGDGSNVRNTNYGVAPALKIRLS